VAAPLATLSESRGERTTTEIADLSQTGLELLAFLVKSLYEIAASGRQVGGQKLQMLAITRKLLRSMQ
jgi:hypothetical protein